MSAVVHPNDTQRSRSKFGRIGPHSRLFRRGAVAGLDGRSAEARFLKTVEAQLTQHVGGDPSVAERVLITRLSRIILRLSLFDDKIASGLGSDFDLKVIGGLDSALRNGLARLGLKGTATKTTLADLLARDAAE